MCLLLAACAPIPQNPQLNTYQIIKNVNSLKNSADSIAQELRNSLNAEGVLIAIISQDQSVRYVLAEEGSTSFYGQEKSLRTPAFEFILENLEQTSVFSIDISSLPKGALKERLERADLDDALVSGFRNRGNYLAGYIAVSWDPDSDSGKFAPSPFLSRELIRDAALRLEDLYREVE